MSIDNQVDGAVDPDGISYEEMLKDDDPEIRAIAQEMMDGDNPQTNTKPAIEDDATQGVDTVNAQSDELNTEVDNDVELPKAAFVDGVHDKSGKNILPYAELENARRSAADNKASLATATAELNKLKRQLDLAGEKGIEMPTLPEDEVITPEVLSELEDISPEFGMLARKVKMLTEQVASKDVAVQEAATVADATAHSQQEIDLAFKGNPALGAIMNDPNQAPIAMAIEAQLAKDPRYASLDARYLETARRVGGAVGEDLLTKHGMSTVAPNDIPKTPQSMSDIASSANLKGKTTKEMLSEMPEHELANNMENMSLAQLEALM